MTNKSLWDVKKRGIAAIGRLSFVHICWLFGSLTCAIIAAIQGVPATVVIIGSILAALPGVVGGFLLTKENSSPGFVGGLLVMLWTVFSVYIVAMTGAGRSPLTSLFLIAPFTALGLRNNRMAIEATVFAVMAFVAIVIVDVMVGLPDLTSGTVALSPPYVLTALLMGGGLIWSILMAPESLSASQTLLTPSPVQDVSKPPPTQAPTHLLPDNGGILALDVAKEGRLRHIEGDHMGLAILRPGRTLKEMFVDGTPTYKLISKVGYDGPMTLANDRAVHVTAEPNGPSFRVLIRDIETADASADNDNSQTEFFASLSHELKTPLNAIINFADMMRVEMRGPMPEAYKDYPDIIHQSGQELLLLVEDIMDYSKTQTSNYRFDLEPVNLFDTAKAVIRQLDGHAARKNIELKLAGGPDVWAQADARAVRQIWQNLVSNAIKYSEDGGQVVLRTGVSENQARLAVRDTGEGMSAADLERIREPFRQGRNAKGKAGTGLGLAVVSRFAEMMDGEFDITSEPGKGTLASVYLPVADMSDLEILGGAAE